MIILFNLFLMSLFLTFKMDFEDNLTDLKFIIIIFLTSVRSRRRKKANKQVNNKEKCHRGGKMLFSIAKTKIRYSLK